jgi:hypothetical protein
VDNVTIQIKYKDVEKTFSGNVEDAWVSINKFFLEFVPSFEIAGKLTLKIDLQKLAEDCEGIIAFSKEGANILIPRSKLTDNETLALWLLANYLGFQLGMIKSDVVSKEELQAKLGKDSKITSTRLGELIKTEMASRTADEKYRITTFGIVQMQKDILPRIKTKMNNI